jgi:hypothetical protein
MILARSLPAESESLRNERESLKYWACTRLPVNILYLPEDYNDMQVQRYFTSGFSRSFEYSVGVYMVNEQRLLGQGQSNNTTTE